MTLVTETNATLLRYSLTLPDVREGFSYRVCAGHAESDQYEVRVESRPVLRGLTVRTHFPPYTGLPDKTDTNAAAVLRAVAGSEMVLEAEASKALSNMTLRIGSARPMPGLGLGGEQTPLYRWKINLSTNMAGSYSMEMVDSWGFPGDPVAGVIEVVPDEPPSVNLVAPATESVKVRPSELVRLVAAAHDDLGIGPVELRVRVDGGTPVVMPVDGVQPVPEQPGGSLVEATLDLSRMNLAGRNRVVVVVRVSDKRTPEFGGAQVAESAPLVIELDQTAESLVRQALEAQQQAVEQQVAELAAAVHAAEESAQAADQGFEKAQGVATPETLAAAEQARQQAARAQQLAEMLSQAVENTPLAGLQPALDRLSEQNLAPARELANTLPLAESGQQAALADQLQKSLDAAAANADALAASQQAMEAQIAALAAMAELANRQQQLAAEAGVAAAKTPGQAMNDRFRKNESGVADALKQDATGNADVTAAAEAAAEAAQAPTAAESAPAAQKAAESLAKAVNAMAAAMMAPPGQTAQDQAGAPPSQNLPGLPQQNQAISQQTGDTKSPSSGQGGNKKTETSEWASKGILGYGGGSSLNWTKAKGSSRGKVGGEAGLRVPAEYKEIVGRYFEELSRADEEKGRRP